MIERLLAAERALADGRVEQAERLFRQVAEADERNAIAVVGLAEVALARGDRRGAEDLATRALAIDPDDAAAARLVEVARTPEAAAAPAPTPSQALAAAPEPTLQLSPVARRSAAARLRAWLARLLGRSA